MTTKKHNPLSGEVVSVALVTHLLDLTIWQGGSPDPILAAAGLTKEHLANPNGWLPVEKGVMMLHYVMNTSQNPLFYLQLSQLTFLSGYGIVGYLLEASPTLKDAILALSRYERLISSIVFSKTLHQPGKVFWSFECPFNDTVLVQQITEFQMGCRYLFMLMVKAKRSEIVSAVHFRHAPPPNINAAEEYGKIFRCPVLFNQAESALVLHSSALSLPLRQVEAGLRGALEAHADKKLNEILSASSLTSQARAQLHMLLHTGHPSRELLAERLNISSRHLSRQLQTEGSSYRALLDELRLEIAQEQLRLPHKSLDDIAELLCFADTQSFMRWFRQQTGQTTSNYRAQVAKTTP